MLPYPSKGFIIFLALYPIGPVAATNFSQCFASVISCANSSYPDCPWNISSATALSILLTSEGSPVDCTDAATAILYDGCNKYCGTGQGSFSWASFSREYSAWLLPFLALLSQLPFGARRRMDNLMSAVLTLGSPTLAGYSLYMTLLNARWVNDQVFSGINYPSTEVRQSVVQVLCSLQQVPLRVHPGESARFESLVVHPDNDEWWKMFARELDYAQTWSIASATSITWVVIAYLLTVANSLSDLSGSIQSNGQGTGSAWLWLVPIVVGWLVLSPKCNYDRVHDAYNKANRQAFVADSHDPIATPTHVTSKFGLTIDASPVWKWYGRNVTSPDESRIPPVFNYARVFSWTRNVHLTSLFYRAAWRKSTRRVGVDGSLIPGNDVPRESRLGTRDQIIDYCRPCDRGYRRTDVLWPHGVICNMIVASLMSLLLQWGTTGASILVVWFTPTIGLGCRSLAYLIYGVLSTTVWILLVSSSALGYYALHLDDDLSPLDVEMIEQRSHSGSPEDSNPPNSIAAPCHTDDESGQGASNVAIPSGIIQAPAGMQEGQDNTHDTHSINGIAPRKRLSRVKVDVAGLIALCADWLRWIGKSLAITNAIILITTSIFQYAGVYDNCYCNSSVYTWGSSAAFTVIQPTSSDMDLLRSAWLGALGLALTCCAFFVGSIYLIRDSLPS